MRKKKVEITEANLGALKVDENEMLVDITTGRVISDGITVNKFDGSWFLGLDVERKPYDTNELFAYYNASQTYQTCISIKANTTCGLGYYFNQPHKSLPVNLRNMLEHPTDNIGETFTQILTTVYADLELYHDAFIGVVKVGNTFKMYHMPSETMYVVPSYLNGVKQRRIAGYKIIEFNKGTLGINMSESQMLYPFPVTGKLIDGRFYVVHLKKFAKNNLYYGTPMKRELHDIIRLMILSDKYNTNFFANGGQPSWAVLATGDKINKQMLENLKAMIGTNLKGVENAHKMLFLNLPKEKAEIKLIPLSKEIDAQFLSLGERLQFRVALTCQVLPKMLGLSAGGNFGGGSAAAGDLSSFIQIVSIPEQKYVQDVLNSMFRVMFKSGIEITLACMDVSTEKDDAITDNLYFNMRDEFGNRVMGINDIRVKRGMGDIELRTTLIDDNKEKEEVQVGLDGQLSADGNLNEGERGNLGNLDPDKAKH